MPSSKSPPRDFLVCIELSRWLMLVLTFPLPLCVDSKCGTTFWMSGRNVGRQAQRMPQFNSTTDQYAAGALSQKGSLVLMPLCSVESRMREMIQVLLDVSTGNYCRGSCSRDLQETEAEETE